MTVDDLFTSAAQPSGPPSGPPAEPPAGPPAEPPAGPSSGPQSPQRPSRRRRTVILLGVVITLLGLLAALLIWYLRTGKPLSQLPGLARDKPPHYVFSIYGVTQPLGVAVRPDGERIYVTESGGQRLVHVYDRSGEQVGTLEPPAATGAQHVPVYVAVNPRTGEIYVSDRMTAAVYVYGPGNDYRRTFTPRGELGGGWAPLGLTFDPTGRLFVTDVRGTGGQRVLVFGPDGTLERTIVPTGGFTFPNGLVVDARGDLEVCDSNNGRVVVFGADGKVLGRIVGGMEDTALGLPRGAAVDDAGRLYIVDAANHAVRMYRVGSEATQLPRYQGSFGTEGTADGAFEYPNGVAADSRARIYVTDRENNRLQVWSH